MVERVRLYLSNSAEWLWAKTPHAPEMRLAYTIYIHQNMIGLHCCKVLKNLSGLYAKSTHLLIFQRTRELGLSLALNPPTTGSNYILCVSLNLQTPMVLPFPILPFRFGTIPGALFLIHSTWLRLLHASVALSCARTLPLTLVVLSPSCSFLLYSPVSSSPKPEKVRPIGTSKSSCAFRASALGLDKPFSQL